MLGLIKVNYLYSRNEKIFNQFFSIHYNGKCFFLYTHIEAQKNFELIDKEYPLLTHEDAIQGVVQHKFDIGTLGLRKSGVEVYVKVANKNQRIYAYYLGKVRTGRDVPEIDHKLSLGDSVIKKAFSDTILLKKTDGSVFQYYRVDSVRKALKGYDFYYR